MHYEPPAAGESLGHAVVDDQHRIPVIQVRPAGAAVWAGIRPERLKVDVGRGEGQPIGKARVESLVSDGLASVATLRLADRSFTTHLLSGRGLARRLRPGDPVSLSVRPDQVHARPLDPPA